jgi:hypothetical protein
MEILHPESYLNKAGNSAVFCSTPGHTSMPGNQAVDPAAREADLHGNLSPERALGSDVRT